MSDFRSAGLAALKAKIAAIEAGGRPDSAVLPFGEAALDGCLPGGGLPLGAWHEVGGAGLEIETAAAPAAFTALMAAPLAAKGEVVWVNRDAPMDMGIRYIDLDNERKDTLRKYISMVRKV